MAPTRYAGRFDGPGIDDSEPGPDTISALFTGDGTVIADPVSFPWSLVDDDGWRQPVIVDLQHCTDTDLVALKTVLPVLTPDDRVIASVEQRQTLARELPLPDDAFLDAVPDDATALFAELRERKLQRAVLRLADAGEWQYSAAAAKLAAELSARRKQERDQGTAKKKAKVKLVFEDKKAA